MMLGIKSLRTRSFTFSVLRERASWACILHTSWLKSGVSSMASMRVWIARDVAVRFLWASIASMAQVNERNWTIASSLSE